MGTTKSTTITALDANPSVVPGVRDSHGRVMAKVETLETTSGDSAGQDYRFFRVNAQDRILSLKLFFDDCDSCTDSNLGIYEINGGAVVDADCYADGQTLDGGNQYTGLELRFNDATTADIALALQAVWEDAGVSADPGNKQYDLCLTSVSDISEAVTFTLQMLYLSGS
jgi:hypothetical protein